MGTAEGRGGGRLESNPWPFPIALRDNPATRLPPRNIHLTVGIKKLKDRQYYTKFDFSITQHQTSDTCNKVEILARVVSTVPPDSSKRH